MATSSSGESLVQQARSLIRKREFDAGIEVLQKLLEEAANDSEARELMGLAYFMTKQYANAREAFEYITRNNPLRASAWINLGAILNKLGEHKKAADVLRRGLQRDRRNAEGYYNLGIAQKALNMNTMAISAYKEAIKLKPEMVDAQLNLGSLYLEMKNFGLAQHCFNAALKQDPKCRKAQHLLDQAVSHHKMVHRTASPFGRLVDESTLANQQNAATRRVLDPVERNEERELIQDVTKVVRSSARDLVPLLDDALHNQLHQLQMVAIQADHRFASTDVHEQFTESITSLRELREIIRNRLLELRSHLAN